MEKKEEFAKAFKESEGKDPGTLKKTSIRSTSQPNQPFFADRSGIV